LALPVIDGGVGGDAGADEVGVFDDAVPPELVAPEPAPALELAPALEPTPPLDSVDAVLLVAVETMVEVEAVGAAAVPLPLVPNGFRDGPLRCDLEGVVCTFRAGIDAPPCGGEAGS
jgi:hypothetical protein